MHRKNYDLGRPGPNNQRRKDEYPLRYNITFINMVAELSKSLAGK
jgi:hypothetical protein